MALPAILTVLAPILGNVLDKVLPDPQAKAKAQTEILTALMSSDLAQLEVNKVEAAHRSIFVAGWRPFLGWVGGVSLAYVFLVQPMTNWALMVWYPGIVTPTVPTDFLFELVLAMLGMGGLRTFEKMKGVTK
jgi:hypothetical protein